MSTNGSGASAIDEIPFVYYSGADDGLFGSQLSKPGVYTFCAMLRQLRLV